MQYFKLFNSSIITQGANRSLLCDIQRGRIEFLPNELVAILYQLSKRKSLNEIYLENEPENREIIKEYIEYLIREEYGFLTSYLEFNRFTELDKTFYNPKDITNAILEVGTDFNLISESINQLDSVGCPNVHLVKYEILGLDDFYRIMEFFERTSFTSVEWTLENSEDYSIGALTDISLKFSRISRITFHSTVKDIHQPLNDDILFDLVFTKTEITSFSHCGNINPKYFSFNKDKILESYNHNSCLNKKISIDADGFIKNCPAMSQSFGKIRDTSLQEVIAQKDFQKYWGIKKDQINICKDCEFRHVCTDCRAYLEDPNNQYSKPLKCGYSPYTNEWADWSKNPLKKKAILHYNMQSLVNNNA